ncbi:MAG: RIP metalloprotease RseP [Gemmatimonadetes bacterium]|nr:RIP metalloprotease RseP [Gemmatimonadota bacterium]
MLAWLAPILVLGLVVFVHELGHFLAAKWAGVYAPRFALGWGKALWKWRPKGGETEYVIAAFPVGGYVRMASRDDETMSKIEGGAEVAPAPEEARPADWDPEAMVPHGPKPVPADRWFESKPVWKRIVILLAGVTMNALLTLVLVTGMIAATGRQVAPAVIPAVLDSVVAGRAAANAGLQRGDSITSVAGAPVAGWADVLREITARPGQTVGIGLVRGGLAQELSVSIETRMERDSASGENRPVGRVGMGPRPVEPVRVAVGPGEAVVLGWQGTVRMGTEVVRVLRGLFAGSVGVDQLGGPIAIARASVAQARSGWQDLLTLIAFLSVNLAVLNLLPIPILDGGQILMTLGEGVRGKPFSIKTRERIMQVGVAAILLLFVVVMFNDIKSLVGGWFG